MRIFWWFGIECNLVLDNLNLYIRRLPISRSGFFSPIITYARVRIKRWPTNKSFPTQVVIFLELLLAAAAVVIIVWVFSNPCTCNRGEMGVTKKENKRKKKKLNATCSGDGTKTHGLTHTHVHILTTIGKNITTSQYSCTYTLKILTTF